MPPGSVLDIWTWSQVQVVYCPLLSHTCRCRALVIIHMPALQVLYAMTSIFRSVLDLALVHETLLKVTAYSLTCYINDFASGVPSGGYMGQQAIHGNWETHIKARSLRQAVAVFSYDSANE